MKSLIKRLSRRLMNKLFTDNNLLIEFSYSGKKGKYKFTTLEICSVIFGKFVIDYMFSLSIFAQGCNVLYETLIILYVLYHNCYGIKLLLYIFFKPLY